MGGNLEKELKKKKAFDSPQQAVVVGLLRTNDMFQYRFAKLFREYGLSEPQYNILRILRGEGQPLPCLEIASRLITMVPAITSLIDKLEKRELVSRQRCTQDRRVWYVAITSEGMQLLTRLDEPVMNLHHQLCAGLSKTDCHQLVQLLEKARDAHCAETAINS